MKRPRTFRALLLALAIITCTGFGWKKKTPPTNDVVVESPLPPPPPTIKQHEALFSDLPFSLGDLASGLPNNSAQGCSGCHSQNAAEWRTSRHASSLQNTNLLLAAEHAGDDRCLSCHRPLVEQSEVIDGQPNTLFDATLISEGVTCAACHLRNGVVVGVNELEKSVVPHDTEWSADLSSAAACAPCHQLTWPGASTPLYDTVGEWSRSPHAAAGLQCQSCHMKPDPGIVSGSTDHSWHINTANALSLLISTKQLKLIRGSDALQVILTLQNSGAGHAFPTGSPYLGAQINAWLEGPNEYTNAHFTAEMNRTISTSPPWETITDSRLLPGEERAWTWAPSLPINAPAGDYSIVVEVSKTRISAIDGAIQSVAQPFLSRILPLKVE